MSHFKKALETVKKSEKFRAASTMNESPAGGDHSIKVAAGNFLKPLNRVSDNPYGGNGVSGLGVIETENLNYDIRTIKTNELLKSDTALRFNSSYEKGYAM